MFVPAQAPGKLSGAAAKSRIFRKRLDTGFQLVAVTPGALETEALDRKLCNGFEYSPRHGARAGTQPFDFR